MSAGKITPLSLIVAVVVLAMVGFIPATDAAAASAENLPDAGRVSKVEGNVFTLGKDDVDWSYAEPNLVIEDGDLFQTDESGRAEIEFANDLIFRIGENSRIAILAINGDNGTSLGSGRSYVRLGRELPGAEQFLVSFPTGEFVAHEPVLARIDVADDGSAQINIIRGAAGIASIAESGREASSGTSVVIDADGQMEIEKYRTARADDFDRWNEELDIALTTQPKPEYLETDLVGAEDLDGYGRWVYVDTYNCYSWQPYVVETWRPYYYGHWYKSRHYGWTWIPEEPWGYVTYHYGSWNYAPHYGWIWVPGYVWRPAHVYWIEYDTYIGWVPLDYYGYPVITTYPYHVVSLYPSGIDFFSFTFVHVNHFHHYDHHYYYHHDRDHRGDDHRHGRGDNYDGDRLDKDYEKLRKVDDTYREKNRTRERHEVPLNPGKRVIASGMPKEEPKARFVKDISRKDIERDTHKGRVYRPENEYGKFLDTKREPAIARKIEKIEKTQTRKAAVSARLPEKPTNEQLRKLTTRQSMQEKRTETLRQRTQKGDEIRNMPVRVEQQKDRPVNRQAPEFKDVPKIKQTEVDQQTRRERVRPQGEYPRQESAKAGAPSTKERLERDREIRKFSPDTSGGTTQQVRISREDKPTTTPKRPDQKIAKPSRLSPAVEKQKREEMRDSAERALTKPRNQTVPQMQAREQAPAPAAKERPREERRMEREKRVAPPAVVENERVRIQRHPFFADPAPLAPPREARQVKSSMEIRAPQRAQVESRRPELNLVQPQARPISPSEERQATGRQDVRSGASRSEGQGRTDGRTNQMMRNDPRGRGR